MGRARDIANVLSSSTNIALDSEMGLSLITPTSISSTGGSSSISASGVVSFTSASAISLNGCFTNTYRNYKILYQGTASATSQTTGRIRLRTSGTDNTASSYFDWVYARTNSVAANAYDASATSWPIGSIGNLSWFYTIDLINPQASDYTMIAASNATLANSNNQGNWSVGIYYNTTSFDGISLIVDSGTFTGTVSVYGYRN